MRVRSLAAALKEDLKAAPPSEYGPLSVKRLAAELDKSEEWCYAVMRGDIQPNVRQVVEWTRVTEGYAALDWIADQCGYLAVRKPSDADPTLGEISALLTASARYVQETAAIYADGRVDDIEAARKDEIAGLAKDLIRAALALKHRFLEDADRALRPRTIADAESRRITRLRPAR